MPAPVTFGIKTSQANTTWAAVLRTWLAADALDVFEHAWLWDHLVPLRGPVTGPALEAWTLLAALAARTSRLRIGVLVSSNRTRHPAVLAKLAATVDQIADGRLVLGIGAGGSRVADPAGLELVERELGAFGFDVVPTGEAVGALGEACELMERLWSAEEPFDWDGRWYQLRGAICEPKPVQRPRPPILIGTAGPRGMAIAARHADIWNSPAGGDVDAFRRLSSRLDEACAEAGRDPGAIARSVQLFVANAPGAGPASPRVDPRQARERLLALIDAGANHIVLAAADPDVADPAAWLAESVVHPVRVAAGLA